MERTIVSCGREGVTKGGALMPWYATVAIIGLTMIFFYGLVWLILRGPKEDCSCGLDEPLWMVTMMEPGEDGDE